MASMSAIRHGKCNAVISFDDNGCLRVSLGSRIRWSSLGGNSRQKETVAFYRRPTVFPGRGRRPAPEDYGDRRKRSGRSLAMKTGKVQGCPVQYLYQSLRLSCRLHWHRATLLPRWNALSALRTMWSLVVLALCAPDYASLGAGVERRMTRPEVEWVVPRIAHGMIGTRPQRFSLSCDRLRMQIHDHRTWLWVPMRGGGGDSNTENGRTEAADQDNAMDKPKYLSKGGSQGYTLGENRSLLRSHAQVPCVCLSQSHWDAIACAYSSSFHYGQIR